MAKTLTFRLTSEGVVELEKQLKSLGAEGEAVFEKLRQSAPKLADPFQKAKDDVDKARLSLENAGQALDNVNRLAGALGVTFGLHQAGAYLDDINSVNNALVDQAKQLGQSVSGLQAQRIAFEQNGSSAQLADTAISKLNVTVGAAMNGSKQARDEIQGLGVDFEALANAAPDERLALVARGLLSIEDSARRATAEQTLFGRSGREVETVLPELARGVHNLADEYKELGLIVGDKLAEDVKRLEDEQKIASQKMRTNLAPVAAAYADLKLALTELLTLQGLGPLAPQSLGRPDQPMPNGMPFASLETQLQAGIVPFANFGTRSLMPGPYDPLRGQIQGVNITPGVFDAPAPAASGLTAYGRAQADMVADANRAAADSVRDNLKRIEADTDRALDGTHAYAQNISADIVDAWKQNAEAQKDALAEMEDATRDSVSRQRDFLSGLFDSAIFGGTKGIGDFFKRQAGTTLSDALSGLVMGGGGGGGFSLPNFGGGAGGFNLGGLGNLGGGLGGLSSMLPGWLGGSFGAAPLIDATTMNLGMITGAGAAPGAGGLLGSLGGLGGLLGGAGMGLGIGSLWGGLGLGKSTGSSIGGAIGGIAGSIIPGVGTILGGLAGSAIGGLFGNDKPSDYTAFANFGSDYSLAGGLTGDKPNEQTIAAAQKAGAAISQAAQMLEKAGIDLQDNVVRLRIGALRDSQLELPNRQFVTVGGAGDVQGAVAGSLDYLLAGASSSDEKLQGLIERYRGEGGLNSGNIDALLKEANYTSSLPQLAEAFNKAMADALNEIVNPELAEYNALLEAQAARLEQAKEYGGDLLAVEALNNAELQKRQEKLDAVTAAEAARTAAEEARAEAERQREAERVAAEAARAAAELAQQQRRLADFRSEIQIGITGFSDPLAAALMAEDAAAKKRVEMAVEVGDDLVAVEQYNGLKREAIVKEAADRAAAELAQTEARAASEAARAAAEAAQAAANAAALERRRAGFASSIAIGIQGFSDPLGASLAAEAVAAQERLDIATENGNDLVAVETFNALRRKAIVEDAAAQETAIREQQAARETALAEQQVSREAAIANQLAGARAGLSGLVTELTQGASSGLTGEQRYFSALSQYNAAERSALGSPTDLGALSGFETAARNLLPVARDFLGTSERYGGLAGQVLKSATQLGGDLADPSGIGRAMVEATQASGETVASEVRRLTTIMERQGVMLEALMARRVA